MATIQPSDPDHASAAQAMPVPTSSSQQTTPGPHASISPKSLAEKPHLSSPPIPKSPMPPTASLAATGRDLMNQDDGEDGRGTAASAYGNATSSNAAHANGQAATKTGLEAQGGETEAQSNSSASAAVPSPPPEVEATLTKLTAHANVTGVLVLSRPEALVIRSGGSYFEPSGPGANERAVRLKNVVNMVRNAIVGLERDVPKAEAEDELSFLRIRTKKYEMMISPSDKYLLVVLQDPTIAS